MAAPTARPESVLLEDRNVAGRAGDGRPELHNVVELQPVPRHFWGVIMTHMWVSFF